MDSEDEKTIHSLGKLLDHSKPWIVWGGAVSVEYLDTGSIIVTYWTGNQSVSVEYSPTRVTRNR